MDPVRIDGYVISFGREKNVKIVSVGCMDDYFFLSLILHLLPLIYPFFTYVDPVLYRYLEYGSGSTTLDLLVLDTVGDSVLDPDSGVFWIRVLKKRF